MNIVLQSIRMHALYGIYSELGCSFIQDSQLINEALTSELGTGVIPLSVNQKQRIKSKIVDPMFFFFCLKNKTNYHILFYSWKFHWQHISA